MKKSYDSFCFQQCKNRIKRHGSGIDLPVPCRFTVVGFCVSRFTGDRINGPGTAAGSLQHSLFLLRELFVGDKFFIKILDGRNRLIWRRFLPFALPSSAFSRRRSWRGPHGSSLSAGPRPLLSFWRRRYGPRACLGRWSESSGPRRGGR